MDACTCLNYLCSKPFFELSWAGWRKGLNQTLKDGLRAWVCRWQLDIALLQMETAPCFCCINYFDFKTKANTQCWTNCHMFVNPLPLAFSPSCKVCIAAAAVSNDDISSVFKVSTECIPWSEPHHPSSPTPSQANWCVYTYGSWKCYISVLR